MDKLICGIHHVAIKYDDVAQFEKAIHFYHDLLGLEIARTWGEGEKVAAMIDTGSGILEIFANGKDLAFATAVPYSARLAFCKGPGGEDVEFFCEK